MKNRYTKLRIGGEHYASYFKDRYEVSWTFKPLDSLSELEELQKLVEEDKQFDFVFVQDPYSEMLMQAFRLVSQPY
ncbi:accessory Sec system protein Asp2, partial [Staphylococcus pseudintermedius]|uniref:accessory Sec system protein Asp2 n=1 Tax=Staphylococcus pseudintermedius TaxID=283734 RepID=UPI000E3669E0